MTWQTTTAFDENYVERFEVLRSVSAGFARCLQHRLGKLDYYNELAKDELSLLEGGKSVLRYVDKATSTMEDIRKIMDNYANLMPKQAEELELVPLERMIHGVLGQYARMTGAAGGSEIDPELAVNCLPYQFQQLVYAMLEYMDSSVAHAPGDWQIFGAKRSVSSSEVSRLKLGLLAGDYQMLGILRSDDSLDKLENFISLLELTGEGENNTMEMMTSWQWLGVIGNLGGDVLVKQGVGNDGVVLVLPCQKLAASQRTSAVVKPQNRQDQPTILLVDDEEMVWEVISAMLVDLGYNVILAANGREAIDIYQSNLGHIDLVLLDMLMPELSGRETFFRLKAIDQNVKVLMSSGFVSDKDVQDVMKAGACGFLQKPYRIRELSEMLQKIFANS